MKSFAHAAQYCKKLEMIDLVKVDAIDVRGADCRSCALSGLPDRGHRRPSFKLELSATQKD